MKPNLTIAVSKPGPIATAVGYLSSNPACSENFSIYVSIMSSEHNLVLQEQLRNTKYALVNEISASQCFRTLAITRVELVQNYTVQIKYSTVQLICFSINK